MLSVTITEEVIMINLYIRKIAHELTTLGRKHIKPGNFALPGGRYPINDRAHARNALARAAQMLKRGKLSHSEYNTIVAKVHARYPTIGEK
jgi:hypothetical protein